MPDHPFIVHLPLGLAMAAPVLALAIVWSLRVDEEPNRRGPVLLLMLHAAIVLSGFAAMFAGEIDVAIVGSAVDKVAIERHEARAELFVWASAGALAVSVALLTLHGKRSTIYVAAGALVISIAVAVLALRTGRSGGELVYKHGAAAAHKARPAPPANASDAGTEPRPAKNPH